MTGDRELDTFLRHQRAATRRRLLLALVVAVSGTSLAVAAVRWLQPTPCQAVAGRLCRSAGEGECRALREAMTRVGSTEGCSRALGELDAVEALPAGLRAAAQTKILQELLGTPPQLEAALEDAARVAMAPFAELERSGSLSDNARRSLVAGPPATCLLILGKLEGGPEFVQAPLHRVLVEQNQGVDLGPTAGAWTAWWAARARPGGPTAPRP
jgi:hypothetical protein